MKPDESENISHQVNEVLGEASFNAWLLAGLDAQIKAVQDFAVGPSASAAERIHFLSELRELVAVTPIMSEAAMHYVERLAQPSEPDVGKLAGPVAWQEQAAPELAAVRIFARRGELTLDDVRQTASTQEARVPEALTEIRARLGLASEAEQFDLRQQRVAIQEDLHYYQRVRSVLEHAFPDAERAGWQKDLLREMAEQPLSQVLPPLTKEEAWKMENQRLGAATIGPAPENGIPAEVLRAQEDLQRQVHDALRGNIFQAATFKVLDDLIPGHTTEAIQASKAIGSLAGAIGGTLGRVPVHPSPVGGGGAEMFERPRERR